MDAAGTCPKKMEVKNIKNDAGVAVSSSCFTTTEGRDIHVNALGKAIYLKWEDVDNLVKNWAHRYFGAHVTANGSREENTFEIELLGMRKSDFEAFKSLYETHDKEGDFEPESDFEHDSDLACTLPSVIALGVVSGEFCGKGLGIYSTAIATYEGVLFAERPIN